MAENENKPNPDATSDNPPAQQQTSENANPDEANETVTLTKKELDTLNKRLADNRKSFLTAQQKYKEQELVNKELNSKLVELNSMAQLPQDKQNELEELKFSDPDAWYREMKELEQSKTNSLNTHISEVKTRAELEARKIVEQELLSEFKHDLNLVPYQLRAGYENGTMNITDFLSEATKFFNSPKTVAEPQTQQTPNLSKATGTQSVSEEAKYNASNDSYEYETF